MSKTVFCFTGKTQCMYQLLCVIFRNISDEMQPRVTTGDMGKKVAVNRPARYETTEAQPYRENVTCYDLLLQL